MEKFVELVKGYVGDLLDLLAKSETVLNSAFAVAGLLWTGIIDKYGSDARKWLDEFLNIAVNNGKPVSESGRQVSASSTLQAEAVLVSYSPDSTLPIAEARHVIGPYLGATTQDVVQVAESQGDESGFNYKVWFIVGVCAIATFIYRKQVNALLAKLLSLVGLDAAWNGFIDSCAKYFSFLTDTPVTKEDQFADYRECIAVSNALNLSVEQMLLLAKYLRRIDVSRIVDQREVIEVARSAERVTQQQALSILNAIR